MVNFDLIAKTDSEIAELMEKELRRQQHHLELIASENKAILERDTMADANSLTVLKPSPSKELKNSSVQSMPMCSLTPVHRQTWPYT